MVPPGDPLHLGLCALEDEHAGDGRALDEGFIDDVLDGVRLAASLALVGREHHLALGVVDSVPQRVGGEAREDDGVDGADANAGEQGDDGLGHHGHVDGDGVALLDAHVLEHVRELADLAQQVVVG